MLEILQGLWVYQESEVWSALGAVDGWKQVATEIVSNPTRRMAPIWSWSQEAQKEHLEVRPALKPGEGARVVKIDGGFAMAARDWVYWRLPTVTTCETFGDDRSEASVRVDRGEVRVGVIVGDVRLGDNWCDKDHVGRAFFLDTFFGVLRDGDAIVTTGVHLKAAVGDIVTLKLNVQGHVLAFVINDAVVGEVQVDCHIDSRGELRMAVQMWDKGDRVYLVGSENPADKDETLAISSATILGDSPVKSDRHAPTTPQRDTPAGEGRGATNMVQQVSQQDEAEREEVGLSEAQSIGLQGGVAEHGASGALPTQGEQDREAADASEAVLAVEVPENVTAALTAGPQVGETHAGGELGEEEEARGAQVEGKNMEADTTAADEGASSGGLQGGNEENGEQSQGGGAAVDEGSSPGGLQGGNEEDGEQSQGGGAAQDEAAAAVDEAVTAVAVDEGGGVGAAEVPGDDDGVDSSPAAADGDD